MKHQNAPVIGLVALIMGLLVIGQICEVEVAPYAPWLLLAGCFALVVRQRPRLNLTTKVGVAENAGLSFQPVWVSSTEHLERFARAYERANWVQRVFGKYPLQPDMPQVITQGLGEQRIPMVLEATGRLTLTSDSLAFTADPSCRVSGPTLEYRNLDDTLRFTIPLASLTRVAIHTSRTLSWYPAMHWLQLVGDAPEGHFNVLLAVGGIRPRTVRRNTRSLFEAVENARQKMPAMPTAASGR